MSHRKNRVHKEFQGSRRASVKKAGRKYTHLYKQMTPAQTRDASLAEGKQ